MNKNIVRDLELVIEMKELRELGLDDTEVLGYFDLYSDTWELANGEAFDN